MDEPPFDNARHLRYWQRCLRTLLPHQYTSNDSTRMTLGCFIVAAIDLLSTSTSLTPSSAITSSQRRDIRAWVLSCQHPGGGFTGGPTHVPPRYAYDGFDLATGQPQIGTASAANIAATLFALQLLAVLAEDDESAEYAFAGVDRGATLRWLRKLQRADGSFGEILAEMPNSDDPEKQDTLIAGGSDMRYCYIAAMIRWMLRGNVEKGSCTWVEDIDVDAMVRYIRRGQTYDGGFAESSMHESHAGYAYCAVAALSLLDRAQGPTSPPIGRHLERGIPDRDALLRWLVSRQLIYIASDDEDEDGEDEDEETGQEQQQLAAQEVSPVTDVSLIGECIRHIGFNGRCNKSADTCYTWWVIGAMNLLGYGDKPNQELWVPSRRFLLDKTQHVIGGFSKAPGGPPDLYHSYLGLAALATMGDPRLKPLDPALCISTDTTRKIQAARQGLLRKEDEGRNKRLALLDMGQKCWSTNPAKAASQNGQA